MDHLEWEARSKGFDRGHGCVVGLLFVKLSAVQHCSHCSLTDLRQVVL